MVLQELLEPVQRNDKRHSKAGNREHELPINIDDGKSPAAHCARKGATVRLVDVREVSVVPLRRLVNVRAGSALCAHVSNGQGRLSARSTIA